MKKIENILENELGLESDLENGRVQVPPKIGLSCNSIIGYISICPGFIKFTQQKVQEIDSRIVEIREPSK